jgi:predicted nucleotide-binding protein (sugar kinase/HSP70/actin superfamily)
MLQSAPKTEVEKMLKMSIAKDKLTDITVVSQKVDATKAVLELTAKTGDGRATSGKVTMVKEGGAWKMDEDAWATPIKKVPPSPRLRRADAAK